MNKSDSIKELATALSIVQGKMKPAQMNSVNPFLKNKYADLGSVIESVKPLLAENGLSFVQLVTSNDHGEIGLCTMLIHGSGEWISETIFMPTSEGKGVSTAQVAGSLISYMRRYALSALLGIYADEDTDGNNSTGHKQEQKQAPKMTRSAAEEVLTPAGAKMSTLDKEKLALLLKSGAANVTDKMREAASVLLAK